MSTDSDTRVGRRRVLAIGIGAGALALVPRSRLVAEPRALVERTIPSSGERLPVIGIGTARRYESITTDAERAPLTAVLRRFAELGGKVIDTAPSYGRALARQPRRCSRPAPRCADARPHGSVHRRALNAGMTCGRSRADNDHVWGAALDVADVPSLKAGERAADMRQPGSEPSATRTHRAM